MTKQEIIANFDPSQPGLADESIFGLPFSAEQSDIIIIPVPWEVTVATEQEHQMDQVPF